MVSGLWEEKGWYNEAEGEGEGDGRGEDIYGQTFHGLGEGGGRGDNSERIQENEPAIKSENIQLRNHFSCRQDQVFVCEIDR